MDKTSTQKINEQIAAYNKQMEEQGYIDPYAPQPEPEPVPDPYEGFEPIAEPMEAPTPVAPEQPVAEEQPTPEPQQEQNNLFPGIDDPKKFGKEVLQGMATPMLSLMDFGIDAVATVTSPIPGVGPGMQNLKTSWDEMTRFEKPVYQKVREATSVILPTIMGTGLATAPIKGLKASKAAKAGLRLGAGATVDATVVGLSDQGLEDNAFRSLSDYFPTVFGPEGVIPVPEALKTVDGESPALRRQKNIYDSVAFSVLGDAISHLIDGARPVLRWLLPKDETAKAYKEATQLQSNVETYKRITEIDQALATDPSTANARILKEERAKLVKQVNESSVTEANTVSPYEKAMLDANASRAEQIDDEAVMQIEMGLDDYSPQVTPNLALPGANAVQSIPPANVAHNKATTAAIKNGISEGDPVPLGSHAFFKKALVLGNTRDAIQSLAKEGMRAGDYDAVIDGVRMTSSEMDEAAWKIYKDIMRPGVDHKELRQQFIDDNLMNIRADGKNQVVYFGDTLSKVSMQAASDLVDLYLGRKVTESSARLMDTFGREVASFTEGARTFEEIANDDRVLELVGDKLQFLLAEYNLSNYIAGFTLQQRRGWFKSLFKSQDADELVETINKEFSEVYAEQAAKAQAFREQLDAANKQTPLLTRALFDAYSYTDGNVDTIAKLSEYFNKQFSLEGFITSRNTGGRMNELVRGFHNVRYNNVLSGLAASKALVGSGAQLITKPLNAFIGHGLEAAGKGSLEPLKRGLYVYGSYVQTTKRAALDAVRRIKQVHTDPDSFMDSIRKDYRVVQDEKWEVLDAAAEAYKETGKFGNLFLYNTARNFHNFAKWRWSRYGTTLMSGIDAATDTYMGTITARMRAYDDVISKHGIVSPETLMEAERIHYNKMFDSNGVLQDKFAKYGSGEIAMNLDSRSANALNSLTEQLPFLKTFMMFPRTAINYAKIGMSYTPVAAIPGISKQARTLYAGDDIVKIKKVLGEHGLDPEDPNAMAMYQNLRTEYFGRIAGSGLVLSALWGYAMEGNIRGNGPVNAAERRRLMDNYGWRPKTIKVGDKWISYEGLPMVEFLLASIGDMAYYSNDIGSSVAQTVHDKLMWTVSATFLNNTPMQGLEPLLQMINGDEAAVSRFAAREIRSVIPFSGGTGVVARAIDAAQKDIYNDLIGYVTQNIPGARNAIPNRIDYWTGKPVNDYDNPILRGLNTMSGIQVTDDGEDWRQWLYDSGWTGFNFIKTSSGGTPFTAEQREMIGQLVGKQQIWKEVKKMMGNPVYEEEIAKYKALAQSGRASTGDLELASQNNKTHQRLNEIVRAARDRAEAAEEFQLAFPEVRYIDRAQDEVNRLVKQGAPNKAASAMEKFQEDIDNLRKYNSLTP